MECQAHTEVTLRSRSKAVPDSSSPTAELTRYTTITCLVCGLPTYRVLQRITPDLSAEEGPVLPTDDWVEKELCKSSTGWIEVYPGCLVSHSFASFLARRMMWSASSSAGHGGCLVRSYVCQRH